MARPRTARLQVGYDQGRRGEKPSDLVANDPDLLAAYDEGLSDHEDAQAGRRRPPSPGRRRFADSATVHPTEPATDEPEQAPPQQEPDEQQEGAGMSSSWLSPPSLTDGSGFLLGLFAYALAVAYLHYGPAGVTGWLDAKFLNNPPTNLTPTAPLGPSWVNRLGNTVAGALPGAGTGNVDVRPRFGPQ